MKRSSSSGRLMLSGPRRRMGAAGSPSSSTNSAKFGKRDSAGCVAALPRMFDAVILGRQSSHWRISIGQDAPAANPWTSGCRCAEVRHHNPGLPHRSGWIGEAPSRRCARFGSRGSGIDATRSLTRRGRHSDRRTSGLHCRRPPFPLVERHPRRGPVRPRHRHSGSGVMAGHLGCHDECDLQFAQAAGRHRLSAGRRAADLPPPPGRTRPGAQPGAVAEAHQPRDALGAVRAAAGGPGPRLVRRSAVSGAGRFRPVLAAGHRRPRPSGERLGPATARDCGVRPAEPRRRSLGRGAVSPFRPQGWRPRSHDPLSVAAGKFRAVRRARRLRASRAARPGGRGAPPMRCLGASSASLRWWQRRPGRFPRRP